MLGDDAGHPRQPVGLIAFQGHVQLGVQCVLDVQTGQRRVAVPREGPGGQQHPVGADRTDVGTDLDAVAGDGDRPDQGVDHGRVGPDSGEHLSADMGPRVHVAGGRRLVHGVQALRKGQVRHGRHGLGRRATAAPQVEPLVGEGQEVYSLRRLHPQVAGPDRAADAGTSRQHLELFHRSLRQPGAKRVRVDRATDAGDVVVAGEHAGVAAMVGRLRLADEDHIATGVGQPPGSRTSEHAAPDHGDVVAVAAHQLEMSNDWMVSPRRVASPRRTCSRRGIRRPRWPPVRW